MSGGIEPYSRRVYYYETDKMGFVHHSNYIRWLEEARMDYMRKIGLDYGGLEEQGVIIPVTSVACKYRRSVYFDDLITVHAHLTSFTGVRLGFRYEIVSRGELAVTGESGHCFLGQNGSPVNLKKRFPELCQMLRGMIEE